MVQVPIIAMCDRGHIQDFPWREWVHKSINPTCNKPLRLVGTGSATLGGLSVRCDCGAKRSLEGITEGDVHRTRLSRTLMGNENTEVDDDNAGFLCQGKRPWLGTEDSEPCSCQLRGTLRSATNVYYAQTRSAIYLQRGNNSKLVSLLEEPPLSTLIQPLSQAGFPITPEFIRGQHPLLLQEFSNEEIKDALKAILSPIDTHANTNIVETDDPETSFRREEFNVLRTEAGMKKISK